MEATLVPERMVHGGRALARTDDGRVVLLRGALPGERVRADLTHQRGVLLGNVTEVLDASPDRTATPEHPGLDYGFVRYPRQLALKQEVLRDAAHRAGATLPEGTTAVRPSPRSEGYRGGIRPAVVDGRLGYRVEGGHEVIPLAADPTANEALQAAWRALEAAGLPAGIAQVALRGNDEGEALAALITTLPERELVPLGHDLVRAGLSGVAVAAFDPRGRFRGGKSRLAGARSIRQRFGRFEATVSATAFAQPNPAAAALAYQTLTSWAPGGEHAVDLFAGSGLIALHLAERYRRVTAVEVSFESVERGRADAARAGTENVTFVRGDARRSELRDAELVAVDPPRAGLARPLRRALTASGAQMLLYLSCDVASWARDAADLCASGWRLTQVEPFDFQPHTHHLEIASCFVR